MLKSGNSKCKGSEANFGVVEEKVKNHNDWWLMEKNEWSDEFQERNCRWII